jgi:hypothetical protein
VTEPVVSQPPQPAPSRSQSPLAHGRPILIASTIALAAAVILGGHDLLSGTSNAVRWVAVLLIAVGFALLATAAFAPLTRATAIAPIGFGAIGLAVMIVLLAPAAATLGTAEVRLHGGEVLCGQIKSLNDGFVSITAEEYDHGTEAGTTRSFDSEGRQIPRYVPMLLPVSSVESMKEVDGC